MRRGKPEGDLFLCFVNDSKTFDPREKNILIIYPKMFLPSVILALYSELFWFLLDIHSRLIFLALT